MAHWKPAACLMIALTATPAGAQVSMSPRGLGGGGGGVVVVPNDPMLDPSSPEARAYAALRREQRAAERQLRILRRRFFGPMRRTERRQEGLRALRGFTSPAALIAMTELFDREAEDVRGAVLDHFASLKNDDGDAALAWEAVHGRAAWYRDRARGLLRTRISGDLPPSVGGIIADALRGSDDTAAAAAGRLVHAMKLYQYIPLMASAQVAARGGGQDRTGDLGWIMIGQQKSFVADLIPVVSNNAVGLDPQIGVATDGVMLRIHDAVVTVYRTEIYRELVAMTTEAWGKPTNALGYDAGAWQDWYTEEFVPYLASKADEPD